MEKKKHSAQKAFGTWTNTEEARDDWLWGYDFTQCSWMHHKGGVSKAVKFSLAGNAEAIVTAVEKEGSVSS